MALRYAKWIAASSDLFLSTHILPPVLNPQNTLILPDSRPWTEGRAASIF